MTNGPTRILVTGAAGFIGSSLADRLLRDGCDVLAVDNFSDQYPPAVKRCNISSAATHPNWHLCETDIRDRSGLSLVFENYGPEAVVHIAGSTGMKASIARPDDFLSNNVAGTRSVLDACRRAGRPRLVFLSTASVYGPAPEPAGEDADLPPPLNPYVATKRLGEELVRAHSDIHGLAAVILRSVTVYGPRQRPGMAIHRFITRIARGERITLYGDGTGWRDYVYVDDLTAAITAAINNTPAGEIINIGSGTVTTLARLVGLIGSIMTSKPEIEHVPTPHGIPVGLAVSIDKARTVLGYAPGVSLEEGLRRTVDSFRDSNSHYGRRPGVPGGNRPSAVAQASSLCRENARISLRCTGKMPALRHEWRRNENCWFRESEEWQA